MSKKEQSKASENAKSQKNSRTSGGVCKLPAGTPKQSEQKESEYTIRGTTDPAVPNRAHTEM